MNKKRFIKYLMGKGLPRNKAKKFAALMNKIKVPYHSCQVSDIVRIAKEAYVVTCILPKSIYMI